MIFKKVFLYFKDVFYTFSTKRGSLLAKGIAYSFLTGSIPLLFLTVSFASYLYKIIPTLQHGLEIKITEFLPPQIGKEVLSHLEIITQGWAGIGIIGIVILIFVAKGIFDALEAGLSAVMDVKKRRKTLINQLFSFLLTFVAMVFFVIASLTDAILDFLFKIINIIPSFFHWSIAKLTSIAIFGFALFGIYKIFYREKLNIKWALSVSFVVSLVWQIVGYIGSFFIKASGRREFIYGILAGSVVFLLWMQIFAILILFGGIIIAKHSKKE